MDWITGEQLIDRVETALRLAVRPPPFPETVALPQLVSEMQSWLADERQWRHAYPRSWRSLLNDVRRSVVAYPDSVLAHAGSSGDLRGELDLCASELADKDLRREELLRRRLSSMCTRLADGLSSPAARTAAWQDLLVRSESSREAQDAARRLFALTSWAGHDTKSLLDSMAFCLQGQKQRPLAPASHRLRRSGERVAAAPRRSTVGVWLRLLFAHLGGAGTLPVGPGVSLYQAEWLAPKFANKNDPRTPRDVANDDGNLRLLCQVDKVGDACKPTVAKHVETPTALVRVELADVTTEEAVARARRTAATLGALGTLHGAAPSLWQVDTSYVTFRDGARSAAEFAAPPVDSASFKERVGVGRDPTAAVLRHHAQRLGSHLPVHTGRMREIAELLMWLRDARSSSPPARLVLCDRAIETVSGWAGLPTPRRFVEKHLIPSWAHLQMLNEIWAIAIDLVHNDERSRFFKDNPLYHAWADVIKDPDLRLREVADSRDLGAMSAVIGHVSSLSARLPHDHPVRGRVEQLERRVRTPQAALTWFDGLIKQGLVNESRRSRTRNALMHGGPLAEATIDVVISFAQYMADEALGRVLDAFLDGEDACAAFIDRGDELARMRRRLSEGTPAHEALVWS